MYTTAVEALDLLDSLSVNFQNNNPQSNISLQFKMKFKTLIQDFNSRLRIQDFDLHVRWVCD